MTVKITGLPARVDALGDTDILPIVQRLSGTPATFKVPLSDIKSYIGALSNPMTTQYDLIVGGASGGATRLALGADDKFLGAQGGVLGYFSVAWGKLSGTLSNQTDLQAALDAKSALGLPQNSKSAAYTTVLADNGKHIYHPAADTTARIWTIDSNANSAQPIGSAITFVNDVGAGVITIGITSDTLVLAGAGTTGSRTLAAGGVATALKVTSTRWIISGTGLT